MALPLAELPDSISAELTGIGVGVEIMLVDAADNFLALARLHDSAAGAAADKCLRMSRVLISAGSS
jgi:hypothetical protein